MCMQNQLIPTCVFYNYNLLFNVFLPVCLFFFFFFDFQFKRCFYFRDGSYLDANILNRTELVTMGRHLRKNKNTAFFIHGYTESINSNDVLLVTNGMLGLEISRYRRR